METTSATTTTTRDINGKHIIRKQRRKQANMQGNNPERKPGNNPESEPGNNQERQPGKNQANQCPHEVRTPQK
eukprot:5994069-Pyramimonas_sp.AAC.1